jgi:hypothetical protein
MVNLDPDTLEINFYYLYTSGIVHSFRELNWARWYKKLTKLQLWIGVEY